MLNFFWYSLVNGLYFVIDLIVQNFFWSFAILIIIMLMFEESRVIEDEFVDEERDLL